jgi:hypothetical protein
MHADGRQLAHHGFVLDGEAVLHEGVIHPATIDVVDVHAGFELFDGNFLDHAGLCDADEVVIVPGYVKWPGKWQRKRRLASRLFPNESEPVQITWPVLLVLLQALQEQR